MKRTSEENRIGPDLDWSLVEVTHAVRRGRISRYRRGHMGALEPVDRINQNRPVQAAGLVVKKKTSYKDTSLTMCSS